MWYEEDKDYWVTVTWRSTQSMCKKVSCQSIHKAMDLASDLIKEFGDGDDTVTSMQITTRSPNLLGGNDRDD